jgi:sialic acid synthase SpsE
MNLLCIRTIRERFNVPIGLSDHTTGFVAAIVAAGIGIDILEKHLTLDKAADGPDHSASANPQEFREMVQYVRRAELMLGDGVKAIAPSENGTKIAVRRMLFFNENLHEGQIVERKHLDALRTDVVGVCASDLKKVIGSTMRKSVKKGDHVRYSDFL